MYGLVLDLGRIFVTTGDLITGLDLTVSHSRRSAAAGETITITDVRDNELDVEIRFRPLDGNDANGDHPEVNRVDLIVGEVTGRASDRGRRTNPTTRVGPQRPERLPSFRPRSRRPAHPARRHQQLLHPVRAPARTRWSRPPTGSSLPGRTGGSTPMRCS